MTNRHTHNIIVVNWNGNEWVKALFERQPNEAARDWDFELKKYTVYSEHLYLSANPIEFMCLLTSDFPVCLCSFVWRAPFFLVVIDVAVAVFIVASPLSFSSPMRFHYDHKLPNELILYRFQSTHTYTLFILDSISLYVLTFYVCVCVWSSCHLTCVFLFICSWLFAIQSSLFQLYQCLEYYHETPIQNASTFASILELSLHNNGFNHVYFVAASAFYLFALSSSISLHS